MDYEELLESFISYDKSLLISPAGYGKTYTIVECVKKIYGKSLILTHTHAGIAAIKKKLFAANIAKDKYQVETITSYAQKYVKSFYVGKIPLINDDHYWQFILESAAGIFRISHIKDVIKASYERLFVDEYQDCTASQHEMILSLSDILPTHILGDPLQGIMAFGEELVDFSKDLNDFEKLQELEIPHRWYKEGNNRKLGDFLKKVRSMLQTDGTKSINFTDISSDVVTFIKTNDDIYDINFLNDKNNQYKRQIIKLINNPNYESLLIIVPEYRNGARVFGTISDRAKFKNRIDFNHQLELLEAIDNREFYNLATNIDNLITIIRKARQPIKNIKEKILEKLFNKRDINRWFNDNDVKNKREAEAKQNAEVLKVLVDNFIENPSPCTIYQIIRYLKDNLKLKTLRFSLLKSILDCLRSENTESVYKAMINQRNKIRRVGRKVEGKCLGTTALTKGLEFDTVVVLDAHNIDCPKNLYVALTRASKKLIVFSQSATITTT